LFLFIGLLRKALIKSIGTENKPIPPKKTTRIHPINEKKAIVYTVNEVLSVRVVSVVVATYIILTVSTLMKTTGVAGTTYNALLDNCRLAVVSVTS
jgi:hypothetical protein